MKQLILLVLGSSLLFACGTQKTTLTVSANRANCTGEAPQLCFRIKENNAKEWSFFYNTIQNFNWEPGYEYVLDVHKDVNKNPPAGRLVVYLCSR